jgi:inorganic pyrophosphatase
MATAATASATAATRFTRLAGVGLRRTARLPTAVRFQRRVLATTALLRTAELRPKEQGLPETLDYRVFLVDGGGRKVSPWHDVPLRAGDGVFHFVVEIPKESSAKMEVATDESFTPIKQDTKKGNLRYYP